MDQPLSQWEKVMRVDRSATKIYFGRTFGEQLRRIGRLPDAPAQLAQLLQARWSRHPAAV
jgi:hypothetical protein